MGLGLSIASRNLGGAILTMQTIRNIKFLILLMIKKRDMTR
jgi:hypothetical protein